jgi:hypothetical protein
VTNAVTNATVATNCNPDSPDDFQPFRCCSPWNGSNAIRFNAA